MKFKKLLPLVALLAMGVTACGSTSTLPTSQEPSSESTTRSEGTTTESTTSEEPSTESTTTESSEIQYGTLTIADINVDFLATATINPVFSIPDMAEQLEYTFAGSDISITEGVVKGLVGSTETLVTAFSEHFEASFKVIVGAAPVGYVADREFTLEDNFGTAQKVGTEGDFIYETSITIEQTEANPHVTINFGHGTGDDRFLIWDYDSNGSFTYVWFGKINGRDFNWNQENKTVRVSLLAKGHDLYLFANDELQLTSFGYAPGYSELEIGTENMVGSFTENRLYTRETKADEFAKYEAKIAQKATMTNTNLPGGVLINSDYVTEGETTTLDGHGGIRNVVMMNNGLSYTPKGDFQFSAHVNVAKMGSWFALSASRSGIVNEWGNYHLFLQANQIHSSYGSIAAAPTANGINLAAFTETEFDITVMRSGEKLYLVYETEDGVAASVTNSVTTDELHVWLSLEETQLSLTNVAWAFDDSVAAKANAIDEALAEVPFGVYDDFNTAIDNGWDVHDACLSGDFVLEADIAISGVGDNPHITFNYNNDGNKRFLLWGTHLGDGDNDLYVECLSGLYWNKIVEKVELSDSASANVKVSIISYKGQGHMLINEAYAATIYNLGSVSSFTFGAANVQASWTNVRAYNEENNADLFKARLAAINGFAEAKLLTSEEEFGKYWLPAASQNFVVKTNVELTEALNEGSHLSFNLNGDAGTRFLLWNNGTTNGYYYGDYGYANTEKYVDATSGSATFELAILVNNGKAYMFIGDEIFATCEAAPAVSFFTFGKGGACAVNYKNVVSCDELRNSEVYTHYIDLLA